MLTSALAAAADAARVWSVFTRRTIFRRHFLAELGRLDRLAAVELLACRSANCSLSQLEGSSTSSAAARLPACCASLAVRHLAPCRFTNEVDHRELAPARNASRRSAGDASISRTAPCRAAPWPPSTRRCPAAPMRTSRGFFDTGTSGNTRIQIWPPRLTWRADRGRGPISRASCVGALGGLQAEIAEGHSLRCRGMAKAGCGP